MIKTALKRSLPAAAWKGLVAGHSWLYRLSRDILDAPSALEWGFSSKGKQSTRRLVELKDRHVGERCWVIGNGPSLGEMDLSALANEITIGLNRIYLMFEKTGFSTSYYVATNPYVIEQCAEEIQAILSTKFINWNSRDHVALGPDVTFIRPDAHRVSFSNDITKPFWGGATVTYAALQIAFHMGFEQVILIGVDHRFETQGKPGTVVTLRGDDPNHFDPRYFADGFQWQLPNLPTSELAYSLARVAFENDGRQIVDATVNGALEVFPKVDYLDVVSHIVRSKGLGPLSLG